MSTMVSTDTYDQLRGMIDRHGVGGTMLALSEVIGSRAELLAPRDAALAKSWDRDATLIERLAGRMEN